MATQNDVKARISALLSDKGLTENKLAGDNPATQKRLNRQLSHDAALTVDTLLMVLAACPGVSADFLLFGAPAPTSNAVLGENAVGGIGTFQNINANDTINRLVSLLEEKDKQINQLLQILAAK